MKNLINLIVLLIVVFSGCSTIHTVGTYDDIYYSPSRAQELAEIAPMADAKPVLIDPAPGNGYQDQYDYNEQYNYDESLTQPETRYDYSYSARIRRFHRYYDLGFGYYDPFFTNMFWYTHDPFYYGVSVYLGYGAAPFYYPGFFHSWGYRPWGWGHHGFGWGFSPMWGSPFHWGNTFGYWAGYHHGFWSGYRHGLWTSPFWHYQYVYNSLDRSNYFYGHRRSTGSTVAEGTTTRGASGRNINNQSFAERFETSENRISTVRQGRTGGTRVSGRRSSEVETGRTREIERVSGRSGGVVPQDGTMGRGARTGGVASDPATRSEGVIQGGRQGGSPQEPPVQTARPRTQDVDQPHREPRPQQDQPERYRPSRTPSDFSTPGREQIQRTTEPRYERPQSEAPARQAPAGRTDQPRPRTYTPPSQQQPRSNQEYRSPGSEQRPQQAAPAQTRPQATPQRPAPQQARPQAVPHRTQPDQERPQTAPQRTAPVQQRATPPTQQRPVAAPQQRPTQSQPQAAPSRAPQRSSSPAVSSPPRSSSPASRSSAPSSSGSSGSSEGSSRSSSGGSGRR